MQRYCLTLDLVDDPELIFGYREHHQNVWPEVKQSILASGIRKLAIYLLGNRLCMVIEAEESFSFEVKAQSEASHERVQQWEALMWKYQQRLPMAKKGEKWMLMEEICFAGAISPGQTFASAVFEQQHIKKPGTMYALDPCHFDVRRSGRAREERCGQGGGFRKSFDAFGNCRDDFGSAHGTKMRVWDERDCSSPLPCRAL
jgi:L-rhamnose mutarotase